MNNLRSFGEFAASPVSEGFFSSSNKQEVPTRKEKIAGKTERSAHRTQLMSKRKEILGKISKIKANLEVANEPVANPASTPAPVEVQQPVAAMQVQLESLRKELREVNKLLS